MRRLLTIIVFLLLTTRAALAQDAVILPYETALARIETAAETEATQLDLSDLGLSNDTLPAEIGQLEHLQELILTGNAFETVPAQLADLPNLHNLYLNNNHLRDLAGIGDLTNLRILVLDRNELSELPTELFSLHSLTYLSVDYNQLTQLPSEIAQLTNLRELHANHNQLTDIPSELAQIQWLNSISFSHNQLRYLPNELGYLDLSPENEHQPFLDGNPLISPPQDVVDEGMSAVLAYLRDQSVPYDIALARIEAAEEVGATTLDLSNLGLTELPPEIGNLTQLTILHAMDNALSSLPAEIGNLKNLCVLELGNNQLTDLPYELLVEMQAQFDRPNCYLFVLQNPLFPPGIEMTSSSTAWLEQLREQATRDHDLRQATLSLIRVVALIGALVLVARRLRGPRKK